jgi:hypothetical protein
MMPRHRFSAAISVLLVSAVGCGSQPPGAPSVDSPLTVEPPSAPSYDRPVTVSGRVLDFSTTGSVAGVTVAFGTLDKGPFVAVGTAISDAAGLYRLTVPTIAQTPGLRPWYVQVDGALMGRVRLTDAGYRGDLFVHPGTCVARYGSVADSLTLRPVAGAMVKLLGSIAATAVDGWYRIDLGCPSNGSVGFNTTLISVTHPDYLDGSEMVGRGAKGVERIDVWLEQRSR